MKRVIFPNKHDLKLPLYFAVVIALLYFLMNCILGPMSISIDLAGICIEFGITFAAFSITALSLLPLLQTKEWYSLFVKTTVFDDIVVNYRDSIWMNLSLLFWGLFGKVVIQACSVFWVLVYNTICVFFIVFIAIFLYRNVQSLIELMLSKKG